MDSGKEHQRNNKASSTEEMSRDENDDVAALQQNGLDAADATDTNDQDENDEQQGLIKSMVGSFDEEDGDSPISDDDAQEEWITVQEAMDRLGTGPFQYKILIASGLCFAADAMQVILLSFLTLVLKEEWSLSNAKTESITSCLFAGAMLGTLVLGPAADRVGRRPMFLISASIISVFALATACANTYGVFMCWLFWVGFGVGGLVVPFDLLAEFLPSQGRGKILLSIEYFWTIGCLYVVVIAYATLHGRSKPNHGSEPEEWTSDLETTLGTGHHWRAFIAICTIPCIVSLVIGYLYVPESALWLASEGRSEDALKVLREAAVANGHADPFQIFPAETRLRGDEAHKNASFGELFTPAWREITFRLWGAWGAFAFGYYGVILAITRVFEKHDKQEKDTYDFDYGAIFLSSAAELVGTTLVILLVDNVGRVSAQMGCYLCAGICVCMLCVLSAWHYPHALLVFLGFAARVFEMGGTCTTWVSTAEILTTEVRSTGHSTANAMARLGAFFCPFLVEGDTPLVQIGMIMLLVHLFTVFCVAKLPETNGVEMGGAVAAAVVPQTDQDDVDDSEQNETADLSSSYEAG